MSKDLEPGLFHYCCCWRKFRSIRRSVAHTTTITAACLLGKEFYSTHSSTSTRYLLYDSTANRDHIGVNRRVACFFYQLCIVLLFTINRRYFFWVQSKPTLVIYLKISNIWTIYKLDCLKFYSQFLNLKKKLTIALVQIKIFQVSSEL